MCGSCVSGSGGVVTQGSRVTQELRQELVGQKLREQKKKYYNYPVLGSLES
jgi:hypothetical protein